MASQEKPSRDEFNSKFVDIQNRIIGSRDNAAARGQVIKEHLHPLVESIHNSDYFGEIKHNLTQRMRDHVDQLGSTASPNVLSLYHLEQQLQSQDTDTSQHQDKSDPMSWMNKGIIQK